MSFEREGPGARSSASRPKTGRFGFGESAPMEGGLASLVIIAKHMAPSLIGRDALDHAVLIDTLLHKFIKLGPEGAVTGALAALDIAFWDLEGEAARTAGLQASRRRLAHEPHLLLLDRRQRLAHG